MTFETATVFIISLILLWIKPGPGQAYKLACLFNSGFLSAFFAVLGVISACVIFFLVAALGYGVVTTAFQEAGWYLKILGAGYLFYLSFRGFRNLEKGVWSGASSNNVKAKFFKNYPVGLLLTLANPLPIFFFLSVLPALVPVGSLGASDIAAAIGMLVSVGLVVDGLLLILAFQIKELLKEAKVVQSVNAVTSAAFLIIGLFLLYSALFLDDFSFSVL